MIALVILLSLLYVGTAHAEQVSMNKADFVKVLNKFVLLPAQLKEREKQALLTAKATADRDKIISELKQEVAKLEELVAAHKELDGGTPARPDLTSGSASHPAKIRDMRACPQRLCGGKALTENNLCPSMGLAVISAESGLPTH